MEYKEYNFWSNLFSLQVVVRPKRSWKLLKNWLITIFFQELLCWAENFIAIWIIADNVVNFCCKLNLIRPKFAWLCYLSFKEENIPEKKKIYKCLKVFEQYLPNYFWCFKASERRKEQQVWGICGIWWKDRYEQAKRWVKEGQC